MTRDDAVRWIQWGLTPRELEHEIRNGVALEQIASAHDATFGEVQDLMDRWGLAHLSGRAKTGVGVVSNLVTKGRK
jgi:hypothetical protein